MDLGLLLDHAYGILRGTMSSTYGTLDWGNTGLLHRRQSTLLDVH
jgi:hypothetical protein